MTNEYIYETYSDTENIRVVTDGEKGGEGRVGSLGLADENYSIRNG